MSSNDDDPPNHYQDLKIPRTATDEEIRTAYKQLALVYHPDKGCTDTEKFRKIKEAQDILMNKTTRAAHDKALAARDKTFHLLSQQANLRRRNSGQPQRPSKNRPGPYPNAARRKGMESTLSEQQKADEARDRERDHAAKEEFRKEMAAKWQMKRMAMVQEKARAVNLKINFFSGDEKVEQRLAANKSRYHQVWAKTEERKKQEEELQRKGEKQERRRK